MNLETKALEIKAVIMDIDGVLTDGRFGYSESEEIKFFHSRDGTALVMAKKAGLVTGAISGRTAAANRRRAKELQFDFLIEGKVSKKEGLDEILTTFNLTLDECLYIGDDFQDIAIIQQVGIGVLVADAPSYLEPYAAMKTKSPGGHGAVREVVDWLLMLQGKWEDVEKAYGIQKIPKYS